MKKASFLVALFYPVVLRLNITRLLTLWPPLRV